MGLGMALALAKRTSSRRGAVAAWWLTFAWAALGQAAEPAEAFVKQLQSRGYQDLAIYYLEQLQQHPLGSSEFQQQLSFHQATALIQAALNQRNIEEKSKLLDRAQEKFQRYIEQQAGDALAMTARAKLADIQIERARISLSLSNESQTAVDRREVLRTDARQMFDAATATYQQQVADLRTRLEQFPKALSPEKDAGQIADRDRLRDDYVAAQLMSAMILYEKSQSYAPDSAEQDKLLNLAVRAFEAVAQKYRQRLAGISASMFQARCLQQLGDVRKALALFEDILAMDGEPALRTLVTQSLRGAMECYIDPAVGQWEAARQRAEGWLSRQRPTEATDSDWLAVKYLLAVTYQHLAGQEDYARERTELLSSARQLGLEVGKYRSEWQEPARQLIASLGAKVAPLKPLEKIATLADGVSALREVLSEHQTAAHDVEQLQANNDAAPADEERLAAARKLVVEYEERATDLIKQSRQHVNDETTVEQLNQLRYYECLLDYLRNDHYRAAVLAGFLASRYPASEEGRRATAIQLAAFVRLYGDGTSKQAQDLRRLMIRTAEQIARQWKGQAEADDALATLVSLEIADGNADQAAQHLQQMSEQSPKRAAAELATGQALYALASNRQSDGTVDEQQARAEHDRAIEILTSGVRRAASGGVTASTVSGTLLAAQHYLNTDRPLAALELLEHPTLGPKTLVDQRHELVQDANLRQHIDMLAILAYVAALPESPQPQPLLDKALAVLDDLKQLGGQQAEQRQMATAYVMLARTLQTQIQAASPERRTALVEAFQRFLEQAAASTEESSVVSWVAESYLNLGRALTTNGEPVSPAARAFFQKAIATYEDLSRRVESGKFSMTNVDRLLMRSRLASAYGEAGDFANAIARFAEVLRDANNQVALQLEAARMLQRWGDSGNAEAYLKAIVGDVPDATTKRNVIWGYGRIAKATAGKPTFDEMFFDCRLQISRCRLRYAALQPSAERRETLQQALADVTMTAKLYPRLGGPEMKVQYTKTLHEIQQSLGLDPTELP